MQQFPINLLAMLKSFFLHREMIYLLVKRDIISRYRGSVIGVLWTFIFPLFMLSIYTVVYGIIFKSKWHAADESTAEFALILFTGVIILSFFTECMHRAATVIATNVNYVKKVIFPLEILPLVSFISSLFQMCVSLFIWLMFYLLLHGIPHWTVLYFPLIFLPLALFIMAVSWVLASFGVYIRDVAQVTLLLNSVLMFITPVFYPVSAVPEPYRTFLYFNPLTIIVEQAREVLVWGNTPHWGTIGILTLSYSILAWLGFVWFQKTRKGFADVI